MKPISADAAIVARILVSIVFLLNAVGVIDQSIPAKEMGERGVPEALVPLLMFLGRSVELVAGLALALGVQPRLAALALLALPTAWSPGPAAHVHRATDPPAWPGFPAASSPWAPTPTPAA